MKPWRQQAPVIFLMMIVFGVATAMLSSVPAAAAPVAIQVLQPPVKPLQTQGNPVVTPLSATGCTGTSNIFVTVCIYVNGVGTNVKYVNADKKYGARQSNPCDAVDLLVNGRLYLSAGRFCSSNTSILEHTFSLGSNGEDFSNGTQLCTRWQSYPSALACLTVRA